MIKKVGTLLLVGLFLSSATMAGQDKKVLSEAEQSCRNWAEEDGISKSAMQGFMLDCLRQMQNLTGQQEEGFSQTSLNETVVENQPLRAGD